MAGYIASAQEMTAFIAIIVYYYYSGTFDTV